MDESTIPADEGEEEKLREMERAIDDFLFSIRENVSNPTDMQNEGAHSDIDDEYDFISSDDCFGKESLPSRKDGPGIPGHVRKLPYESFKNKHRLEKGNVKNYGKANPRINHPHEEWRRRSDREFGQSSRDEDLSQESSPPRWRDESFSPSSDELHRERSRSPRSDCDRWQSFSPGGRNEQGMRRVSPNRRGNYPQQGESIPRGRHKYKRNLCHEQMERSFTPAGWRDESLSPSSDELQQERRQSPRSDYYRGQSFSPSRRKDHQGVRKFSPNREGNYPLQREFIPRGRPGCGRRNFYQEEVDELSQDRYVFEERNYRHKRTFGSRSRSYDDGNVRHRELSRGSNSPIDWSESYDYDSDNEDQHSSQSWRFAESRPYMDEDMDGQSATSLVTTILREAIAHNPDIATKVTEACLALINKPSDESPESDYECDRDSWTTYKEESGRVSPQSWWSNRSPSFTESLDASSSRSGFTRHSDRFHGRSKRSVLERSISPDDREARWDKYNYPDRHKKARYSPDRRLGDTRSAAASETQRARKRSSSEHSKNHYEEEFDLKGAVSWSIRKIRKQCRREKSSVVRRALLSLLEVHEKECKMYMKKPEAHPDYNKEYRDLVDQKIKSIVDLGGDPNDYDFEQDWRKHWPVQMYKLFQESWNTKMHSCTSMLQEKCGSGSVSSYSSSRKSFTKQPHEKRTHEEGSEEETVETERSIKKFKTSKTQRKLSKVTHSSSEDQHMSKQQEDMNNEIFSILKLLNHIKHRFKDCEASFDKLYVKAMSLKKGSVAVNDVLQGDIPLLEKIDEKLKETLEDVNLTLIQKAVIQETRERFRSFLKKSKEISVNSAKNKEVKIRNKLLENVDSSMENKGEHQIPCHLTNSRSSAVSSNCGTSQQVGQPRRTLMEISLLGPSTSKSSEQYTPENTNVTSFLSRFSQGVIPSNREFTPDVISMEKHTNQPIRTLTEISLVGSSSTSSSVSYKHNMIVADKDSDMTQPPPPGVTPPPPGVTPPPPGVTPPPPGVTPPPPGVSSPLPGVTPPPPGVSSPLPGVTPPPPGVTPPPPGVTPTPPGVTPTPPGVTLPPPGVTSPSSSETPPPSREIPNSDMTLSLSDIPTSPHGETLLIPGVTHLLPEVTPSCSAALPPCITPPPPGISPSNSVTKSPCQVSAPSPSVETTSHSVTTVPCCVTPVSDVNQPLHSVNSQPSSSTSDVALSSLSITTTTKGVSLSSSVQTHSQAPVLDSSSLPPAASCAESHSANDKTYMASQHLSPVITPSEQSCKATKHIVKGMTSKTDTPPQPSKELLRSTIKDCFLSSSLREESNVSVSKEEELLRIGTSAEECSVASVPSLSEEILKMFEIKPMSNDRINSDEKETAKMDNIGSSGIKSTAKKPIKITIPQFSKQKRMPELNPMADDQELL